MRSRPCQKVGCGSVAEFHIQGWRRKSNGEIGDLLGWHASTKNTDEVFWEVNQICNREVGS